MEAAQLPADALPPGWSSGGAGAADPESAQRQAQQEQQEQERRKQILDQIMTVEARLRLSNIAMVKPEKARRVEEMLMHAAKSGALGGKVTEGQFIQMLEQVSSQMEKKTKVTIKRKTYFDEEDSDDNDDDMM
ncbi:unnamed protein product [Hapterophycus canaliculatus]